MTGRTNFHLSIDRGENRPFYRQIFQIFWLQSLKVKTIRTSVLIEKSFFFYEKERAKYAIQTILIYLIFHKWLKKNQFISTKKEMKIDNS